MNSASKIGQRTQRAESTERSEWTRPVLRTGAVIASLVAALLMSACGGSADPVVSVDVGILIGGQPVGGVLVKPGGAQNISVSAGQSIELDASEPVRWTLEVGGTAVTGGGVTVYYQGVSVTVTALSSSRIALDTYAPYRTMVTVPVTLTAISTIDSAQVATVNVLILN